MPFVNKVNQALCRSLKYAVWLCLLFFVAQGHAGDFPSVARFAYVVNPYDYTISGYTVDDAGLLQPNGSVFTGSKYPAFVGVHPAGTFVYTASRTDDTIHIYRVDPVTGWLSRIPGSPVASGVRSPFSVAFHPSGKFMYMAARAGFVSAYVVDGQTGMLTLAPDGIVKAGERTRNLTVHPSGNFVYATNAYTNNVSVFRINQKTGSLSEIKNSPFNAGENNPFDDTYAPLLDVPDSAGGLPYYICIHPSGKFAYVTNWKAASISVFRLDTNTGDMTLVERPVLTGLTPYAVAAHPSGKYVYTSSWASNDIWGYSVDESTGKLTMLESGSVETKSAKPVAIRFNPQGTMAYITNTATNNASVMKVDVSSGKMTLLQNIRARGGALDIGLVAGDAPVKKEANFAFLVNASDSTVRVNRVDNKTGKFTEVSQAKVEKQPVAVTHDPLNRFVYVANAGSNSVSAFRVDQKNGQLTEIDGSPYKVGDSPVEIAIDNFGWYIYIRNKKSNNVHVFLMHLKTGQLAEVRESPLEFKIPINSMALDHTARLAYFTSADNKTLFVYRHLKSVTAAVFETVNFGSPFVVKEAPISMVIHPDGVFGLLVNKDSDSISMHRLNHGTGGLVDGDQFSADVCDKPATAVFDPSGDYAYISCPEARQITIVKMDKISGKPGDVTSNVKTKYMPVTLVNDPAGMFLYSVNASGKPIERFKRNGLTGQLVSDGFLAENISPVALSISSRNNQNAR